MDFLIPSASFGISMAFSASSKTEAALIFCSVCIFFFEAVKEKKSQVITLFSSFDFCCCCCCAHGNLTTAEEREKEKALHRRFLFSTNSYDYSLMRSIIDAVREKERECALI